MKEQSIRSGALGLGAGFILAVALLGLVQVELARAQRAEGAKPVARPKWEYCAIPSTGVEEKQYSGRLSVAYICYFNNPGCQGEKVAVDGSNTDMVMAKAISQLGSQGWEMVGMAPRRYEEFGTLTTASGTITNNPFVIYFKRPKT